METHIRCGVEWFFQAGNKGAQLFLIGNMRFPV